MSPRSSWSVLALLAAATALALVLSGASAAVEASASRADAVSPALAYAKANPGVLGVTSADVATNPADGLASPFGWQDTDGIPGPEFTITRGNNVHAYTDRDNDGTQDTGGSPDGAPGSTSTSQST